jgi:hypothetical protein
MKVVTVLAIWLVVSLSSASYAESPNLSTTYSWGRIELYQGLARVFYWKSGAEGHNGLAMADGKLQARKFMDEHPGDWCVVMVDLKEGHQLQIHKMGYIELAFDDGRVLQSTEILITESPVDRRFWRLKDGPLVFNRDWSPYVRTRESGWFPLYVQFEENSFLGKDISSSERRFIDHPTNMALVGGEEVN